MISVMNGSKVDGNSASSADVFFFGMDSPLEERSSARDGTDRSPRGVGFNKARVSELNLKARASNPGKDFSGSSECPSDSVRVSESEAGRAAEGSGIRASLERAPSRMNGFKVGDMVWGKVKSHPWWPGYIFNEAFASFPVRKMRREGHVLVAFFGDSSFGWFDPAELIPFGPHFAEKSRQTISRNFAKAVEEAVDEVSRRGALSLACHCCSLNKFRPTAVPGYFLVEVTGFEPGGIYSSEQIEKARVNFQPAEALSFVKQLAVVPQRNESSKSVDWIRRASLILAYRRAVYEEFDETYAQAFGVQPVRPSKSDSGMADQPTRAAPLSGPLVIAEALGDKNIPSSSSLKKNKYVLKPRDETQTAIAPLPVLRAPGSGSHGASDDYHFDLAPGQQPQASAVISSLQSFREAALPSSNSSTVSLVDKYVLQKRPQVMEDSGTDGYEVLTDSWKLMTEAIDAHGTHPQDAEPPSVCEDLDDRMLKSEQPSKAHVEKRIEILAVKPESKPVATDEKPLSTDLEDGSGMTVPIAVDSTQPKLEMPRVRAAEGVSGTASVDYELPPSEAHKTKVVLDVAVKKDKVRKHTPDDGTGEVRRKKKKKKNEAGTDLMEIPKTNVELAQTELQREQVGVGRTVPQPKLDFASPDLQLPQFLTDLKALALDSFHGIEHNTPDAVRRVFLRFRSKVYRKSLVLAPASDNEVRVVQSTKPADLLLLQEPKIGAADIQKKKKPKPTKSNFRPHDPTMAGRKRGPSDRQEEMSANRANKLIVLKTLARERNNAGNSQKADQKATTAASQTGPNVTAEPVKKREPPLPPKRVPIPTYLVMKFPPRSTLPSVASLKARFARFGTLELDATRVYWKSFTCKVLFKYKSDAEDAMNYGKSNELFGQFKVNYYTRELEATTMEPPSDPEKSRSNDGLQFRPGSGNGAPMSQPRPSLYQRQRGQQGSVQLKSILKKPSDEASPAAGVVVKGVKFMLGGDNGRREPPVAVAANNSNGSGRGSPPPREPVVKKLKSVNFLPHVPETHRFAPVSTAPFPLLPTSHDEPDIQRFPLPPPPPPVQLLPVSLPPPPPLLRRPQNGQSDATKRSKADISHQMLNLLLRCRDIVTSVKSSLGYVPYHHAWR